MFLLVKLLVMIPLLLAPPELRLKWASGGAAGLNVAVVGHDSVLASCVKSGLEARYRFDFRMCRRRAGWFDGCEAQRSQVNALRYDPISETYRIISDRIGDREEPVIKQVESASEALSAISAIESLPLTFLKSTPLNASKARYYVALRVLSECRGEYNETMERISYFLTLGLVKTSGFDSGWIDFGLDQG